MLCKICIGVLKHRANLIRVDMFSTGEPCIVNAHHRTTQSLESSAEERCQVCFPLWNQLSPHEQEALRASEGKCTQGNEVGFYKSIGLHQLHDWLTETVLWPSEARTEEFSFVVYFRNLGIDWESVAGVKKPDTSSHTLQRISAPNDPMTQFDIADNTASEESWIHVPTWLDECFSTHTRCNELRGQNEWYPTRLLDVGHGQKLDGRLRLIWTSREVMNGPYCTLSHCWGQAKFIQLSRESESSLVSGISVHELPRTFREAVAVTRRLGVQYLWIDSLCIYQDNKSDWTRESGLMYKVYSLSYCNISASAAEDSTGGLFRTRHPNLLLPTQIEVRLADLGCEADYGLFQMYDRKLWTRDVSSCTINKRAWVLQERLLAPRVLHFGENQLLWECMEHAGCELYPNGLPAPFHSQSSPYFKALDAEKYRPQDSRPEDADYFVWNTIVSAYSRTLLTVASDKLIALSGIANKLSGRMNDVYVAGMWRRHLVPALLWSTDGEKVDRSPSSRPSDYRAPTWSWACIDGVIFTESDFVSTWLIDVVDYKLEYLTHDVTGAITGGWLDLRGYLKPFSLGYSAPKWRMALNGEIVRSQDKSIAEWERASSLLNLDVPSSNSDAFDEDNTQQRLYYLVSRAANRSDDNISILLLRLCNPDTILFERIGMMRCSPEAGLAMLEADLPEDVKTSLPCSRYEDGLHTIRIV